MNKNKINFVAIFIVILVLIFSGHEFYSNILKQKKISIKYITQEKKIIKPDKLEINKMYFGDVFWGRYVNDWAQASELKEKYPFSGLDSFGRENYQAWIGSLNCPITEREVPSSLQDETLTFNCTPNYLSEAKKWFNIFSLANSHTNNQNIIDGFVKTRQYLDENGTQYFGHYDKDVTSEICEIVTIKAKPQLDQKEYTAEKNANYEIKEFYIPFALCGYHNTFSLPTQDQLDEIAKYANLFPTFVYAIQGKEYPTEADDLQREYFRKMIDEGADAVIGKSAHVVQDTEAYKGKPIIYSMGNFIYDQQFNEDVTQGIGVEVKINFIYDENLEKWQTIAKSCYQFKDNCLARAQELNLAKPKYSVTYNIIATDNSNHLAKKASAAIQEKMLLRTNWLQTLQGLEE